MSTSTTLSTLGISVQPELNVAAYDAIHERMVSRNVTHSEACGSFSAAWKGVVYRYRAACEYSTQFNELNSLDRPATVDERYLQDHALFSFSVSALSALECFYFGMNCVGCVADSSTFPIASEKDLKGYPKDVVKRYLTAFPADQITIEMQACASAPAYEHLSDMRNVLTHRGAPPRLFKEGRVFMPSNPKELSPNWKFESEVDSNTTETLRAWLESRLNKLLSAAQVFSSARI